MFIHFFTKLFLLFISHTEKKNCFQNLNNFIPENGRSRRGGHENAAAGGW
jgi:hypothetical protein